jgi:hypothetical protein
MSFFDAIGSIAKAALPMVIETVFPEAALIKAADQMLGGAIGDVVCNLIDKIGKDMGVPKFITDAAKDGVKSYLESKGGSPSDVMDEVMDKAGGIINEFKSQFQNAADECWKDYKKDVEKKCGSGKGGSAGQSFLVVLAKILGELENKQFDKVVKAGQDVSDALGGQGDKKQGDLTSADRKAEFDKMEILKGESQTMSTLANSVSTTLDGIFKAATTAAQKVG